MPVVAFLESRGFVSPRYSYALIFSLSRRARFSGYRIDCQADAVARV